MGQNEYDDWSLNNPVKNIDRLNAPKLNEKEIELITKAYPKKILDIGCGNGRRLFSYLKQMNIKFIGIEKFQRLAAGSEYYSNIIIADILEIDISSFNSKLADIDTVTILGGSLNGVFGFNNHQIAWRKIIELLPLGGKIIFDSLVLNGFENNEDLGERIIIPNVTPPQFFLSQKQLGKIWTDLKIEIIEESEIIIPAPFHLRYYLLNKGK